MQVSEECSSHLLESQGREELPLNQGGVGLGNFFKCQMSISQELPSHPGEERASVLLPHTVQPPFPAHPVSLLLLSCLACLMVFCTGGLLLLPHVLFSFPRPQCQGEEE